MFLIGEFISRKKLKFKEGLFFFSWRLFFMVTYIHNIHLTLPLLRKLLAI